MRKIIANGFEPLDACLYRHDINTNMLESVLENEKNRHLATLPTILPARTEIYVPAGESRVKEVKQLWD